MTFAKTKKMIDAATAVETSDAIYPQRRQDETGKIQVEITGGSATVKVQGRSDSNAPWATILTLTESDMGDNDTVYSVIELTPHMRVDLATISGATVNVWISE